MMDLEAMYREVAAMEPFCNSDSSFWNCVGVEDFKEDYRDGLFKNLAQAVKWYNLGEELFLERMQEIRSTRF